MNKVTICGVDTDSLPRLTAARSEELLAQIEEGNAEAKELFLRANMRLVLSVVGRFSASSESADDLFQAGKRSTISTAVSVCVFPLMPCL